MAKHCMKLTSHDIRPINADSYRAGPYSCDLGETAVDKRLCMYRACKSEWKSPIVFAPKKDESLHFSITRERWMG